MTMFDQFHLAAEANERRKDMVRHAEREQLAREARGHEVNRRDKKPRLLPFIRREDAPKTA